MYLRGGIAVKERARDRREREGREREGGERGGGEGEREEGLGTCERAAAV